MPSVRVRLSNRALVFGRTTSGAEADQAALDTLLYAQHKAGTVSADPASPEAFDAFVEHLRWCGWQLLRPVEKSSVPMNNPRDPSGSELKRAVERFFGDEVTRAVLRSGRESIDTFFRERSKALRGTIRPRVGAGGERSTRSGRTNGESPEVEGGVLCILRSEAGGQQQAKAATFGIAPPLIAMRCARLQLSLRIYQAKRAAISTYLLQEIEDQVRDLDL